jgi:Na+-driven multidrug efflux pump
MLATSITIQTHCYSQGVENAFAAKNLISFISAALSSYVLVVHLGMGVYGWLIGRVVYEALNFTASIFTLVKKAHPDTWGFIGFDELKLGYGKFLWDSLQFAFSSYSESLGTEVASFFIFRTPYQVDAAAYMSTVNLSMITYCIASSLGIICRTRINLLLGKQQARTAKNFYICYICSVLITGFLLSGLVWLLSPWLTALLASSSEELEQSYNEMLKIYYLLIVVEVVSKPIEFAIKMLGKVRLLLIINIVLLIFLNFAVNYWISVVERLRIWYNVLSLTLIYLGITVIAVFLVLAADWSKALPESTACKLIPLELVMEPELTSKMLDQCDRD